MAAMVVVVLILALLVVLFMLPLAISVKGQADEHGVQVVTRFYLLGILAYRKSYAYEWQRVFARASHSSAKKAKSVTALRAHVLESFGLFDSFLQTATITKWEWRIDMGLSDAALTGMAVGVGYALAAQVDRWLAEKIRFRSRPLTVVTPHYHEPVLHIDANCILKSRLGKATHAALRLLIVLRRRGKRGKPSDPVSNVHHT